MRSASKYRELILTTLVLAIPFRIAFPEGTVSGEGTKFLRVHLAVDKSKYLVAEPIFLTSWYENTGGVTQFYPNIPAPDFVVVHKNGDPVPMRGLSAQYSRLVQEGTDPRIAASYKPLDPGKTSNRSQVSVLDFYGVGFGYDLYLTAGEYKLRHKSFPSDTLEFEVAFPKSAEDSSACILLVNAADKPFELKGTSGQCVDLYSKLLQSYPHSVYTPVALRALLNLSPDSTLGFTADVKRQCGIKMITEFPLHGFAYQALWSFEPSQLSKTDSLKVLQGLQAMRIETLPFDRLRARVDELIEKLESK